MSIDLNLQDGREKVYINEKMYGKDRYININFRDLNLYPRMLQVQKELSNVMGELEKEEKDEEIIEKIDKIVKDKIDYLFDDPNASKNIFGNVSSLSYIDDEFFVTKFLQAITPLLEEKSKAQTENISKYLSKYDKKQ